MLPRSCCRRRRDRGGFLFPVSIDTPFRELDTAIKQAVGSFYEILTCQMMRAKWITTESGAICPDACRGDFLYEVKASSSKRWIIETEQLNWYHLLKNEGRSIFYVLWSYRGTPPLKSVCRTKRHVFEELVLRTSQCWVLPLSCVGDLIEGMKLRTLGGSNKTYTRPGVTKLPSSPHKLVTGISVTIESVEFCLSDLHVVYRKEKRNEGHHSNCPF